MSFYKRNLPHWQPEKAMYFVTARLAGSLPKEVIENMNSYQNEMRKRSSDAPQDLDEHIQRKIFQKLLRE